MKKGFGTVLTALVLAGGLSGCATRIELNVQRTPVLNTVGIQRIAIMPFEASVNETAYQNAARHATNIATDKIRATNHFTLINPTIINDTRRRGAGIESHVDALFTGRITRIEERTNERQRQVRDRVTNVTVTQIYYVREVEVDFSYHFVRARDGSLIGPISKKGRASDTKNETDELASIDSLVNRAIDNQLVSLHRDIVPHTIRVYRTLEREKNKELKPQMDAALTHVKRRNYSAARQAYLAIWETHRSVAAAVNASILQEAMGETGNAADFMQQVFAATGSPLAGNALARLNRELSEQAGVRQYSAAQQNPVETVTNHAINEIRRVLPADAKLWIHNNETSNQDLIKNVIDNMVSSFIRNNITVVDRQIIDFILREQNFQMEGHVSDNDFIGIGNLAGANTIVIVGITGTGAGRRLQIRVLDIARGILIMQSGIGSEWTL